MPTLTSPPQTSADVAAAPRGWRSAPGVFLAVILAAQLMVVLDATIVNVALPHIQAGLHFSSSQLSWVLNAYLLTFGGLLLLGARAGDLLGRRRTFLSGIALFSLSSLVGGFATTGWLLLAARSAQGIGGALAAPTALAMLTTRFSDGAQRVRAIGLFTTVSAAGGAVGLVGGGILTELVSWRWVMFVNVPIGVAVFVVGRGVLVDTPRRTGRFDLAGAITSTIGVGSLVFGLVEASSRGWTSSVTVASLVVGVVLLRAFVTIERRAAEPIVPLHLLTDRTRSVANVARGLVYAGMYGSFFFLGQFLQDVGGYSPLRAGVSFLPIPASVFLSSQIVSRFLAKRVAPKVLMMSGISLAIVALALLGQVHAGSSYATIACELVLLGLGSGTSLVALTTASLANVNPADAGAASGLVNVIQQVGAAFGLAILVAVMSSASHHVTLAAGATHVASLVHGIDTTFAAGALFGIVALALVGALVRIAIPTAPVATREAVAATELVDEEGFEFASPELVA